MEAKIKLVRPLSDKGITDDPVFVRYIEDAAHVNHFIARTLGRAAEKVKARSAPSFDELRLRQRLFRLSTPIGNLVEAINTNSVVGRRALEPMAKVGRMLRVGVTPGINQLGFALCSNLHIQHVIVPMPAIAQRAAVEDQEALMLEWSLAFAPTTPL